MIVKLIMLMNMKRPVPVPLSLDGEPQNTNSIEITSSNKLFIPYLYKLTYEHLTLLDDVI